MGTNPAINLKHNRIATLSRGVVFVKYGKMELHPQLGESLSKAVKQSKFYLNLDGCVFKLGKVAMETGGIANATDRVRFSACPHLRFDPLPSCVTPTNGIMRELPIDKWSHTRQMPRWWNWYTRRP